VKDSEGTVRAMLFIVNAVLCGCASAPDQPQVPADDGLVRVENALLDELYVAPGVSLAHYQRVMVDPVEATFRDGWKARHPDMSSRDIELLGTQLAQRLRDTLVNELARGGYLLAEAPAPDVLRLRASIEDIDFPGPEMGSDISTHAYYDGYMTLRVLGFDAASGALVARARDHEEDMGTGRLERADRVRTMVNAQKMFDDWARELRSALDVAKVRAGARTPQP
jgi:uncharacterized protein DUF3313